jgi:hypothetical protein
MKAFLVAFALASLFVATAVAVFDIRMFPYWLQAGVGRLLAVEDRFMASLSRAKWTYLDGSDAHGRPRILFRERLTNNGFSSSDQEATGALPNKRRPSSCPHGQPCEK